MVENKEKYINFNVNIKVKLSGVSNKDGDKACKNIQLRFIDNCRFMPSSPNKLECNYSISSSRPCAS